MLLSGGDETDFAVSFDGSFSRGFEGTELGTEFIVSPPIINEIDQAELKGYLPKGGRRRVFRQAVRLMVTECAQTSEGEKPCREFWACVIGKPCKVAWA